MQTRPTVHYFVIIVVRTIVTASSSAWVWLLQSTECTQRRRTNHTWTSGCSTASPLIFGMNCTGCPFKREWSTVVCVLVYKCLHQAAPRYLAEMCKPVYLHLSTEVITVLQLLATVSYVDPKRRDTDKEVSLFLVRPCSTHCRHHASLIAVFVHSWRPSVLQSLYEPLPYRLRAVQTVKTAARSQMYWLACLLILHFLNFLNFKQNSLIFASVTV